jgi:Transcriptional regulator
MKRPDEGSEDMRRKKEDMLITKEQILNAAFECFYENGFERTSLEEIANRINVTRGAIYWHFTDKKTLYRAVVDFVLEHGDVADLARKLPLELTLKERLNETFWIAMYDNRYVDFVYKAINYVSDNEEFSDVLVKLRDVKRKLWQFFDEEISIYIRINHIKEKEAKNYSSALLLLFEGMFLTKNIAIDMGLDRNHINIYIGLIISDLVNG